MESKADSKVIDVYSVNGLNKDFIQKIQNQLRHDINYVTITRRNIKENQMWYDIYKELTISAIEKTFGVNRNEWLKNPSKDVKKVENKCRYWFAFIMSNVFYVAYRLLAPELNTIGQNVVHYINYIGDDNSPEVKLKYKRLMAKIFTNENY